MVNSFGFINIKSIKFSNNYLSKNRFLALAMMHTLVSKKFPFNTGNMHRFNGILNKKCVLIK